MTGIEAALARLGWRTADGSPVSREPPYGATVVVSRPAPQGEELLLLHRAHRGPDDEGDWAWGPPAGARLPWESPDACARRELLEETGLALDLLPHACGTAEWAVYRAVAPPGASVRLSPEHDRHAWLPVEDAAARCRPPAVGEQLRAAAAQ